MQFAVNLNLTLFILIAWWEWCLRGKQQCLSVHCSYIIPSPLDSVFESLKDKKTILVSIPSSHLLHRWNSAKQNHQVVHFPHHRSLYTMFCVSSRLQVTCMLMSMSSLAQAATDYLSFWGTLDAHPLYPFLTNNVCLVSCIFSNF
jgi:hypothetical protein